MISREYFIASMAYMQKMLGKTLEKEVLSIYWQHLSQMTEEKFLHAVQGLVREFIPTSTVPFPLIPHFLKYCGESNQSQAKTAIMRLKWAIGSVGRYNSVDLGDPVMHGVIQRWGGWIKVCNWSEEDWQLNQRKFEEDYEAAKAAGIKGPDHLAGLTEAHNSAGGHLEWVDPPYLVYETETGKTVKSISHKKYESLENLSHINKITFKEAFNA